MVAVTIGRHWSDRRRITPVQEPLNLLANPQPGERLWVRDFCIQCCSGFNTANLPTGLSNKASGEVQTPFRLVDPGTWLAGPGRSSWRRFISPTRRLSGQASRLAKSNFLLGS